MLSLEFDDTEIKRIEPMFEAYGEVVLDLAVDALQENLAALKDQLPDDPKTPLDAGYPSPLRTDKQRRWWWANVKEGKIPGWRFTDNGTLEKVLHGDPNWNMRESFTVQMHRTPFEVYGELGTDLPFAPWVIGPDYPGRLFDTPEGQKRMYQSRIHAYRDRWWQLDTALNRERTRAVADSINDYFWQEIQLWVQIALENPGVSWRNAVKNR